MASENHKTRGSACMQFCPSRQLFQPFAGQRFIPTLVRPISWSRLFFSTQGSRPRPSHASFTCVAEPPIVRVRRPPCDCAVINERGTPGFGTGASEANPSVMIAKTPIFAAALEPIALRLLDLTASDGCRGSSLDRILLEQHVTASRCDL